ncbi:MAG TPA: Type 1 glutamine amidotransferase-like domain-containing protein [Acidimicrobiales bacterium]|nr:Type 1 glutamine amidotransferase-like domain-containing protein [Acidimicrobiales bacterium]
MTGTIAPPGPLALVGSGEYLPSMAAIEAGLLEGRPARYVQLATAAVPDGPEVVARWHELGRAQAQRLGVEAVVVPVTSRADAHDPALAALVEGAGLVYLSGGDPHYLADTLRDSLVWRAIEAAWREGAALAGCSAGAMALGAWIPSIRHPQRAATAGLGLLGRLGVIPHFDAFGKWVPDFLARMVLPDEDALTVLGIDEETALVGGPSTWRVEGRSSVWRLNTAHREQWPAGTAVELTLA